MFALIFTFHSVQVESIELGSSFLSHWKIKGASATMFSLFFSYIFMTECNRLDLPEYVIVELYKSHDVKRKY